MPHNTPKTAVLNHGEFDEVKFTDKDNHIFFMKMGQAIEICRHLREWECDLEQDAPEFADLWTHWRDVNRTAFSAVVVRPHATGLMLFFAPTGDEFDVRLSERLADLETEAVSRLSALKIETRQVSQPELDELREIEKIRQHADPGSTHQPVEA